MHKPKTCGISWQGFWPENVLKEKTKTHYCVNNKRFKTFLFKYSICVKTNYFLHWKNKFNRDAINRPDSQFCSLNCQTQTFQLHTVHAITNLIPN